MRRKIPIIEIAICIFVFFISLRISSEIVIFKNSDYTLILHLFNTVTDLNKLFDFNKIIIAKKTLLYSALATGYVCFLLFDKPKKKNQNVIQVIINPNTFSTYDKYKDKYMNKYNDNNDDNYY